MKASTLLNDIRAECLDCCCGQENEVLKCPVTKCGIYPFRLGRLNPINLLESVDRLQRAIYHKCIDCSGNNINDAIFCKISTCKLWKRRPTKPVIKK